MKRKLKCLTVRLNSTIIKKKLSHFLLFNEIPWWAKIQFTQKDLSEALEKAERRIKREKKQKEKINQQLTK